MPTEMLRVETMSEAERTLIGLLTPAERRDALMGAARSKQLRLNRELLDEYVARMSRGEIDPVTVTDDGRPYPTNGETFYYQNDETPLESIGRLPLQLSRHILRKPDGSLVVLHMFDLRRPGEIWQPLFANDD